MIKRPKMLDENVWSNMEKKDEWGGWTVNVFIQHDVGRKCLDRFRVGGAFFKFQFTVKIKIKIFYFK